MSASSPRLSATAFHARTAEACETNDWAVRNGVTVPRIYADTNDEALAARFRSGLIDISWRWRVLIEGVRAGEFLSRLATRDVAALDPGQALKALWLSDGGGVRGAGVFARFGRESFRLVATTPDMAWIARAAKRFDVTVRELSASVGGLALVGPYAAATLARAGLTPDLEPLAFRRQFWGGLDVTLSRWGEFGGYELWCTGEDAIIVWDRLMKSGAAFGLQPIGLAAADILDVEAGVPRPGRDYVPASLGDATGPHPRALGLETLIGEMHDRFNGRTAYLATREEVESRLVGIEIDSETAAPHTPLMCRGSPVGRTLTSVYSPALRRAIALAEVDVAASVNGTPLSLTLAPTAERPEFRRVSARVVDLPFLPAPDQIMP